jgi:hypothetical protein
MARVTSKFSSGLPRNPLCDASNAKAAETCGAAIDVPCRNE